MTKAPGHKAVVCLPIVIKTDEDSSDESDDTDSEDSSDGSSDPDEEQSGNSPQLEQ